MESASINSAELSLNVLFAAELFSKLSEQDQAQIISQIVALLSHE